MYNKNMLICEGSELSFEEVRAKIVYRKQQRLRRQKEWGTLSTSLQPFQMSLSPRKTSWLK